MHSYLIGLHVQAGDWITEHTVRLLTAGLAARSNGTAGAAGRAVGLVAGERSPAGLLAHLHRRVSSHRLGVGRDADPPRDAPKISIEFPRPCGARRGPAAGAHERPVMTLRASTFALLVFAGTGAAFAQQPEPPRPGASRFAKPSTWRSRATMRSVSHSCRSTRRIARRTWPRATTFPRCETTRRWST